MKDAFKWDCRGSGVCVRNPFYCKRCGSVDVKVDQNVMGLRGKGDEEFLACRSCGHSTEVPKAALGGRWGAIRAEETAETWDAEDAGWDATLRGTYVEVAGPGPVWLGFLVFYKRECPGHQLTGTAVVEVIDPRGSGREAGAVVEVGAGAVRRAESVPQQWREAQRLRALEHVKELEERRCGK